MTKRLLKMSGCLAKCEAMLHVPGMFTPSCLANVTTKCSNLPVSTYLLFVTNDQCPSTWPLLSMSPLSPDLGVTICGGCKL